MKGYQVVEQPRGFHGLGRGRFVEMAWTLPHRILKRSYFKSVSSGTSDWRIVWDFDDCPDAMVVDTRLHRFGAFTPKIRSLSRVICACRLSVAGKHSDLPRLGPVGIRCWWWPATGAPYANLTKSAGRAQIIRDRK